MQMLGPLRTTNDISKGNWGLGKAWPAKDEAYRELMFDCVLKVKVAAARRRGGDKPQGAIRRRPQPGVRAGTHPPGRATLS